MAFLCISLSACGKAKAFVSEDYSKITYQNQTYTIVHDYFYDRPVDSQKVETKVENTEYIPIFDDIMNYDDVYVSENNPDFLWLLTTMDYPDGNDRFQDAIRGNVVMYKLQQDDSQFKS